MTPFFKTHHFSKLALTRVRDLQAFHDPKAAVDHVYHIYKEHVERILNAFDHMCSHDKQSVIDFQSETFAQTHDATYPYAAFIIGSNDLNKDVSLSFGVAHDPGVYGTTLTRPDLFYAYYLEQFSLIMERHNVPVYIGVSDVPIPLPFVMDEMPSSLEPERMWEVQQNFVMPDLSRIDDNIANSTFVTDIGDPKPLSLFTANRVEYSLQRLHHYSGTAPEHFQSFVLLTNYQRYIDEFIEFGLAQLKYDSGYTHFVMPGNVIHTNPHYTRDAPDVGELPKHLPQMPSYHLKRADGQGITFINIGVGPTNAKNITDHLAVLRSDCWIMLGHCAGLRANQVLGDYVLAHAYVREDKVLDQDLPSWVPVPAIAEVQLALEEAVLSIAEQHNEEHDTHSLKVRMRTGTVVCTDNRNWEIRIKELSERFRQSRAIALDMESATVAANGFRFRVPYGTLLCVSDKPLHGELKMKGMANSFYQERVSQHLQIGLEACRLLREKGTHQLHSRKLRGFDEPPFR